MKTIIRKWIVFILSCLLKPLKRLIPKGPVIILQTYSPYIYCENTRYLYEYLSQNTSYEVYWDTEHPEIIKHLHDKGWRVVSNKKWWHRIITALRARMVIDSGSGYFNPFGLIGDGVIKICTLHGCGPKATTAIYNSIKDNLTEIHKMNQFDYVNFTTRYSGVMVGKLNLKLPHPKIVTLGYPRCDAFFNKAYTEEKYKNKPVLKYLGVDLKGGEKIILYTPTWRPYSYDFPLCLMKDFDIRKLHSFLEQQNAYFFYTCHTANIPLNFLPNTSRIQRADSDKFPLFDINQFMMEIDILLNDYSTTSTDVAILNRPQIFFMPDYNYYFEVKGFIEEYRPIMPGKEVHSFADLENTVKECLNNPVIYTEKYSRERNLLLSRYYDMNNTNSCKKFSDFIGTALNGFRNETEG